MRLTLAFLFFLALSAAAQSVPGVTPLAIEQVKPSSLDATVKDFDEPHAIVRPAKLAGAPLVVFMPGTGGQPMYNGLLMRVIAGQGYRVIGLEYPDVPAVTQVCVREIDRECAENFRAMRLWGEAPKHGQSPVANTPAQSIVGRLTLLLKWLDKTYPDEGWSGFLDGQDAPVWAKIVVSGQSQGAGMAAFIAKRFAVARVVCFSSPVDFFGTPANPTFAPWLTLPSATPMDRWYATRNTREPLNRYLPRSYALLKIPEGHIRVLALDLRPGQDGEANPLLYHGAGIRDPRYIPDWKFLFGAADSLR